MNEFDKINDDILSSLSSFTKRLEDAASDRFNQIRGCSFFDPVPSEFLSEIVEKTRIVTFHAGAKIATEQDILRPFYVLIFGTASVQINHKKIGRIQSGECLGESAFFTREAPTRSATVIAESEVIAVEMGPTEIDSITDPARIFLDKALLLALFKKLQSANKQLTLLLHD
ncbi:MAG: cyclic nucleotide-binding domain-containing protein [Gallionella sp.]